MQMPGANYDAIAGERVHDGLDELNDSSCRVTYPALARNAVSEMGRLAAMPRSAREVVELALIGIVDTKLQEG